jgi:hypothetical protein
LGSHGAEQFENDGSTPARIIAPTALETGKTYHVAVTYDGSQAVMYIDGAAVGSINVTGPLSPGLTDLTIGGPDYASARWDGVIDDVAIYPTALTASRINEH